MTTTDPTRMAAVLVYARGEQARSYASRCAALAAQDGNAADARFWERVLHAVADILATDRTADTARHRTDPAHTRRA